MKFNFRFALVVCGAAFISLLSSRAATVQVQVGAGGQKFTPKNVTINAGDTIEWVWAGNHHTSTSGTPGSPDGMWDSGINNTGFVFSHTFSTAETFTYYCSPHGVCCGMIGSVVVNAAALPTVTLSATDASASEVPASDTGRARVTRTGATTADLTVFYTIGGTATNRIDYQKLQGRATIRAGASSANISVRPIDDAIPELDETVILTLSPNASYTIGSPNSGTITLHSDE